MAPEQGTFNTFLFYSSTQGEVSPKPPVVLDKHLLSTRISSQAEPLQATLDIILLFFLMKPMMVKMMHRLIYEQ
jgi:hypothetical protein